MGRTLLRVIQVKGGCDAWFGGAQRQVDMLMTQSYQNEMLLDIPFSAEEVSVVITKLKSRKSAGPDGLMAEHLKAGGESVVIWLMNVLNAVVEMKVIPVVLKRELLCQCVRGKGKTLSRWTATGELH